MLLRTHYALIALVLILFLPNVSNQFLFIGAALVATLIPDIDIPFSKLGQFKIFRFLQIFVRHRGMLHSLSFAALLSLIIAIFWPAACFGFFIGYVVHIFADSFTKAGIGPFWPFKMKTKGFIRTGGYTETVFFVVLIILAIVALIFVWFI